ncbi:MAG TPA: hypothetical protein VEJ47_00965 [Candidatus Eremiobacteraceae bacterium]|nr:hypothetical protein [Candidatus Eremiobacteraceae bacterium]
MKIVELGPQFIVLIAIRASETDDRSLIFSDNNVLTSLGSTETSAPDADSF